MKTLIVMTPNRQQKKIITPSLRLQNDMSSSRPNSIPPTGALNATANPADAPAAMKFLLQQSTPAETLRHRNDDFYK